MFFTGDIFAEFMADQQFFMLIPDTNLLSITFSIVKSVLILDNGSKFCIFAVYFYSCQFFQIIYAF